LSPNKINISYSVRRGEEELEDSFQWLIQDLKEKRENMDKTIIFCRSLKDCGEIFLIFDHHIQGEYKHFAMYHSKTPTHIQKSVLDDFLELNSS